MAASLKRSTAPLHHLNPLRSGISSTAQSSQSSNRPQPHHLQSAPSLDAPRHHHLFTTRFQSRRFSTHPSLQANRVFTSITTPPLFHDYLRSTSANNTLLLLLFTTSSCSSCRQIAPLLESLTSSRPPKPTDKYSNLAYAEAELDSPDQSNGPMSDLAVEWGIRSIPTLVGFGGRRSERVTERIVDVAKLRDRKWLEDWVDEEMRKGDPFRKGSGGDGGGKGILAKLFGS